MYYCHWFDFILCSLSFSFLLHVVLRCITRCCIPLWCSREIKAKKKECLFSEKRSWTYFIKSKFKLLAQLLSFKNSQGRSFLGKFTAKVSWAWVIFIYWNKFRQFWKKVKKKKFLTYRKSGDFDYFWLCLQFPVF